MNKRKRKDKKATLFMPPFFIIIKNGEYRDPIY
jgi:hypothetical protein